MNILCMSLEQALLKDEFVQHMTRLRHPNGWFKQVMDAPSCFPHTLVLFALDGGKPVGMMLVTQTGICGCFVDPSYRRQGVGTELVQEALKKIPVLSCTWDEETGMCFWWSLKSFNIIMTGPTFDGVLMELAASDNDRPFCRKDKELRGSSSELPARV